MTRQLLFLCVLLIMSTAVCHSSEINLSRSKLVQLALHLEVADKQLQYDFSRIAIIEMWNTYEQELQRSEKSLLIISKTAARNKGQKAAKKRAKIRRWQIATQSYLKTLDQYLFLMDSGRALEFLISKQNKIIILIGKQPVIISGPNSGGDKQIEQNIVNNFCFQYDCTEYFAKTHYNARHSNSYSDTKQQTESDEQAENYSPGYGEISGSWAMHSNMQADFIVSNGLRFNFSSIKNKALKQSWAIGISQEISRLYEHLQSLQQKGNKIQWSSFRIQELPLTDNAYKIIINNKQDYIKMAAPLLGKNQALFKDLIPWMQSYFENKTDYRMIIKADRYFRTGS